MMKHPFYPSSSVFTGIERKSIVIAVGFALAGLIVGFFIGWYARPEGSSDAVATTTAEEIAEGELVMSTTTATGTISRGVNLYESVGELIRVTDQKAGGSVSVAAIALSEPGWVAVREEIDGEGGRILGARWFPEGEHASATVKLLRGTMPGNRYHAYLFLDDGDKRFEPDDDAPITRDGLLILTPFVAY